MQDELLVNQIRNEDKEIRIYVASRLTVIEVVIYMYITGTYMSGVRSMFVTAHPGYKMVVSKQTMIFGALLFCHRDS